jgi:hypothetical protein
MPLRLSPDVVFRELDGEAVILDLASGSYFGLNDVGTRVWQLIDQGSTIERVLDTVAEEYEADRETIVRDVLRLIDELRARGLLVTAGQDPEP